MDIPVSMGSGRSKVAHRHDAQFLHAGALDTAKRRHERRCVLPCCRQCLGRNGMARHAWSRCENIGQPSVQCNAAPAGSINTSIGGEISSLWQNASGSEFLPRHELLQNLKIPSLKYDRSRRKRAATRLRRCSRSLTRKGTARASGSLLARRRNVSSWFFCGDNQILGICEVLSRGCCHARLYRWPFMFWNNT